MESACKQNSKYEILTPSGWSNFDGIKQSYKSSNIRFTFDNNRTITCTDNHLIRTNGIFVQASDLKKDHIVDTTHGPYKVTKIELLNENIPVYDAINVEKNNEYYTNEIISHNCEFLGSSNTLIAGPTLKRLVALDPIAHQKGMKQYIEPVKEGKYVIVGDVSEGKGLDYHAAHVISIHEMPYRQCYVFHDNEMPPADYARLLFNLSKLYNDAVIMIEINGIGHSVAETLFNEFECESMIYTEHGGAEGRRITSGFGKNVDRGLRMTPKVKAVGCSMLKLLVEGDQFILNDSSTHYELSRFSRKNKSWEAERGARDDLVMPLVGFAWLTDQPYFKELTDINTLLRLRERTDEEMELDMVSFGFVTTGKEEHRRVIDLNEDPYDPEFNDFFF